MRFHRLYKLEKIKRIRSNWRRVAKLALKYSRLPRRQFVQHRWQTLAQTARIQFRLQQLNSFIQLIIYIFLLRIELEFKPINSYI